MKVKRLYTIGDSWTYGDEIPNPEEQAWPNVLSQEFDCEFIGKAICGGSNDWMFRKTIEWVSEHKNFDDTIVIVAWSGPNRREENYQFYPSIIDDDKIERFIFSKLYNDELEHYKSICYMITLQEFLKSKNIKHLFFQPWYDILGCEKGLILKREQEKKFTLPGGENWLFKNNNKKGYREYCYSEDLIIGNIIREIDKNYCIGPSVKGYEKEYCVDKIVPKHPSKEEHKIMAKFIKEKLVELYG